MEPARPLALRPEALPAGTVVGHWRVVERLGVGGYGAVYRVEDVNHPVAVLALKLALRPGDARAGREVVLLMEKAVHPHVVRFHGCGRWPDPVEGHTYHVMDLVPGLPLDVWTGTLNPSFLRFAEVGAKMALTLGELHGRGVLHRDVKPENILIRETDGEPVLVDFGVGDYEGAAPLTTTPLPPGTPHLRSPEAMRWWMERGGQGGASYAMSGADDLYALGVGLYRAATGHYPFKPEALGDLLALAIATAKPRAPRDINRRMPRALSDVLMRMLAKEPGARYRDGAEAHEALMAAAAFGGRAQWEASLFEWEEVPGAREGGAPGRRILHPAWPARGVRLPPPPVRLIPGDAGPGRLERGGRAEAPAAGEGRRRSGAWSRGVVGAVLGLGLAVAVWELGPEGRSGGQAPAGVGDEMARAPDSSDTGSAAAPLPLESTPAAAASHAASSQDETPMKPRKQKTPAPPKSSPQAGTGNTTLRDLCLSAGVAAHLAACASAQWPQTPKPEECPPGALVAMTRTLGNLFIMTDSPFAWNGPLVTLAEGSGRWIPVREGDTSVVLSMRWGKLPADTVLTGKMYFARGRVFGRLTRAWTPQGTTFPICAELWEEDERGLDMKPGSTRDNVQAFSSGIHVQAVRHFD